MFCKFILYYFNFDFYLLILIIHFLYYFRDKYHFFVYSFLHLFMPILVVWFVFIIFWLLSIYSVSIHESFSLTLKLIAGGYMSGEPSNYFYFWRQIISIIIALIAWLFMYFVPIKFFQKDRNIIIISAILFLLQLAVFIPWVGLVLNGARWWIAIAWRSIQPAEFFKLGYVIFMSSWLIRKSRKNMDDTWFLWKFIVVNFFALALFFFVPDFGTILILAMVWLVMCWYAGVNSRKILLLFIWWIILTFGGLMVIGSISDKFSYIQKRFTYFLSSSTIDPQNKQIWRQNEQALMAIGWWWLFGRWYGKWLQKFGYIPEAQSDFVFAAYSEEIWFVWNMMLLWLYFYLCYYFISRLNQVKDEYSKMIWLWIVSLIIIQMFVNIWVNTKIMPNTWITLPFISYWWTAIMINVIEIVLLYKILKGK